MGNMGIEMVQAVEGLIPMLIAHGTLEFHGSLDVAMMGLWLGYGWLARLGL